MSWLVSSIANSLKLDEPDDNTNDKEDESTSRNPNNGGDNDVDIQQQNASPRGVKEDLSEISKTLTRQLWGVASFLAPPPPQISDRDPPGSGDSDRDSGDPVAGIRSDLSEIGGRFRTGISKLSGNKAVSEFTKIASNLLQFGLDDEDLSIEDYAKRGVIGVTDEVVAFARDVALHPETWLDFPFPDDDDDDQDFDLSDAQQEHALAVERLAPELSALRIELCLGYMSEASFWKIYFVLVHPRLSKQDAEILSTPEIVRARSLLAVESNSRSMLRPYEPESNNASAETTNLSREESLTVPEINQSQSVPVEISAVEPAPSVDAVSEMDKHTVTSTEIPIIDKTVVQEVSKEQTTTKNPTPSTSESVVQKDETDSLEAEAGASKGTCTSKSVVQKDEDDEDDWLEEHTEAGASKETSYPIGNDDEDISFSDLEEDDEVPANVKKVGHPNDKVSGNTLTNKESSDWLDVEDIDVA